MSGSQQLLLGGSVQQAVDPYFYSVTSLLHGDGTNGGQNNTFLDSSTNNFTITRNGNTTQGSFSPFSQTGWGNYFDGDGDYLSVASNAAFAFPGDFTIEAWVYPGTQTKQFPLVVGIATGPTSIQYNHTSAPNKFSFLIGATRISGGSDNPPNTWYHVAAVRSGSTVSLYINGTSVATTTSSASFGNSAVAIGGDGSISVDLAFVGYISNARIVKGTAVYTSNFTPSTTPLTAISGTSLLTCQANRFLDASSNNFTITRNGDVSVQPFSPFNPTTAYSTSAVGGSGYFDGSGDYLSVADNTAFDLSGSTSWCIETWIYWNSVVNEQQLLEKFTAPSGPGWTLYKFYNNPTYGSTIDLYGGASAFNSAFTPVGGEWNHVVVCRNNTQGRTSFFINGTRTATSTTFSISSNASTPLLVGARQGPTAQLNGYLSGTRIVKGGSVYDPSQTSITVPTAPLTAITNTSLLCNFTNGAIFDNAAVADYETVGNAQISTSVKKYGTGSMSFDGTGDYLLTRDSPNLTLGAGDFTVEAWVYPTASPSQPIIVGQWDGVGGGTGLSWVLLLSNDSNRYLRFALSTNGSGVLTDSVSSTALALNAWNHVALVRCGSVFIAYLNGTSVVRYTISAGTALYDATNQVSVGSSSTGTQNFNGYIDDLRISKGICRYPYNFTPPTAEFPNIGGTVTLTADPYFDYTTLLLPGNGTNGAQNNTFLDSSTNNFTITRNGNTTQGTFSPFSQTGWGNYFNFGTPDALRPSATGISNFGTGAFTIEFWISFQNTSPAGIYYGGTTGSIFIDYFSGSLRLGISGGSIPISYAFTPAVGIWYHVAFVRSSTTDTLYINGTSVATGSDLQNYPSDSGPYVGSWNGGTYTGAAYLSNVRVVKGTAVYTANFTPSTTPLTAISGTSLLTCQSNRFIDNSTNAFAITTSGSPTVQAFSPFNPTAAWSAATYGGSGYFDGSGDYLTAANNAAWNFGTGDFTVEFFAYVTSFSAGTTDVIVSTYQDASNGWTIGIFGSTGYFYGAAAGDSARIDSAVAPSPQWNHLVLVRSGTTLAFFVNGARAGTLTNSTNISSTSALTIGTNVGGGALNFNGYMAGLRIVKGTAVYDPTQSTLTVPTAPVTAVTNTQLLLSYTNAGIYDATSKNDLETVGNAQISTTQSKFGGSSMYFDGSGDYLYKPSDAITSVSGDFTIEAWVYRNTNTTHPIVNVGDYALSTGILFYINNSNALAVYTNNAALISGGTISATTWTHVAVVRYGSTVSLYVNGFSVGTPASNTASFSGRLQVGADFYSSVVTNYLNGYIDDLRITKGIARYTSNFTPPTTAFLTL